MRLHGLVYRAAQRMMTLDISRLMCLDAAAIGSAHPELADQFSFRFLTFDEVYSHSFDPANDLSSSFADRMLCGRDLCYAALAGDTLAAYVWLALGSIEAEQNRGRHPGSGVAMSFGNEAAFVYKAFTRPEFRGRRLYPACLKRGLVALSSRGVSRLLVTADWTNHAALAGCRQAGFRDVGTVWRLGWAPALYTLAPRASASLGIRLGAQARVQERLLDDASCAATGTVNSSPDCARMLD